MKQRQSNEISFKGQNIYVGIDVHLKSWSVTVLSESSVLKRFVQDPDPDVLHKFLTRNYPEADYYSVYEAGFCGFWIHERLTALGIDNIVINPADVPTTAGERIHKTDAVDSAKLARSLRAKELKGIYTPDSTSLEVRSLIRLRARSRRMRRGRRTGSSPTCGSSDMRFRQTYAASIGLSDSSLGCANWI